jgi:hypothetical protein
MAKLRGAKRAAEPEPPPAKRHAGPRLFVRADDEDASALRVLGRQADDATVAQLQAAVEAYVLELARVPRGAAARAIRCGAQR